jgi:hypothetical protein
VNLRAILTLATGLGLGACAGIPAPEATRSPTDQCVALFQRYDLIEDWLSTPSGRRDRWIAPPPLMQQAQWLRNAGCITLTRDLDGMETLAAPPAPTPGPAIAPISLHAGVVTNMADDARSIAFFSSRGLPARSVGSAPLGRRVYVGPFASEGELAAAHDLAVAAGFVAPYAARF